MEQQIQGADFVLLICTPEYANKSKERSGGAGYEATIITPDLAGRTEQTKFVPVLRTGSWEKSVPIWLRSRIGIDLRGDPYKEDQWFSLLRHLHSAHEIPPPIGPKPSFADKSYAYESQAPSQSVPLLLNQAVSVVGRTFTLEGAAQPRFSVGHSGYVVATVTSRDAGGLRAMLETDDVYPISDSSIKSQEFNVQFPCNGGSTFPISAVFRLRSPDFQPPEQEQPFELSSAQDSPLAAFMIKAGQTGTKFVTVDVLVEDRLLATRSLQTEAVGRDSPPGGVGTAVDSPGSLLKSPLTLVASVNLMIAASRGEELFLFA